MARIWIDWVTVDCRDPRALAAFWREALDYDVEYSSYEDESADEEVVIAPKDRKGPRLLFLRVPEGKTVKNRLHLDIRSHDQQAHVRRLEELGARRVDIGQGDVSWIVMQDPEGNEFCILRDPTPEEAKDLFYA
jgi:predicted enzyme related to lactoylglutathione lyase